MTAAGSVAVSHASHAPAVRRQWATMAVWSSLLGSLAILGSGGCLRRPVPPSDHASRPVTVARPADPPLVDRTAEFGIDYTAVSGRHREHATILESLGSGVGWFDYDRDGRLDLVCAGGGDFGPGPTIQGAAAGLFRNRGASFNAVARAAGLDTAALYSHGVAIGDYDNDGFADLLVTGYGVPHVWHNLGDGTFRAQAALGGTDRRWSTSAGWADFDGDGCLDLYLTRYVDWSFENHPRCGIDPARRDVCPPRAFAGLGDSLYRSTGDGGFVEMSSACGLRDDGKGLGVLLADVDLDGDVDIYVANDTVENFLYVNDGSGMFTENGLLAGVAFDEQGTPNGSMGVSLCDYDRDGLPDIWVANYEREAFALYRNEGGGRFFHVSRREGITDLGGLFVGFGTVCTDFDADGEVDIAVANGHVINHPVFSPRRQLPLLLRHVQGRFVRATASTASYFGVPHEGRGLATGDVDGDGDPDLAVSHLDEPIVLLLNESAPRRRLTVELVGTVSNRDAVGARLELSTAGRRGVVTQVVGGGSYLSHSDTRPMLVVPDSGNVPLRLTITWPAGGVQTVSLPASRSLVRLVEPRR
jgi:hypothetical protein